MEKRMSSNRYRVVALMPTEMFIEGDDIDNAIETVNWLKAEYPGVEYSASSTEDDGALVNALPIVLSVEQVDPLGAETDADADEDNDTTIV
jgi:hypothetical protein